MNEKEQAFQKECAEFYKKLDQFLCQEKPEYAIACSALTTMLLRIATYESLDKKDFFSALDRWWDQLKEMESEKKDN